MLQLLIMLVHNHACRKYYSIEDSCLNNIKVIFHLQYKWILALCFMNLTDQNKTEKNKYASIVKWLKKMFTLFYTKGVHLIDYLFSGIGILNKRLYISLLGWLHRWRSPISMHLFSFSFNIYSFIWPCWITVGPCGISSWGTRASNCGIPA